MPVLKVSTRSAVSGGVVAVFGGALVLLMLLQQGESTARVDLDDSGVWVTKTSAGLLGRFNNEAQALDGTLLSGSSTFDVQQAEYRVLMTDPGTATASPVDPAQLTLGGTMSAPAGAVITSGGHTAAVLDPDDGRLWVLPFEAAVQFSADDLDPTAELGPGARVAVATDGTVFGAAPAKGRLATVTTNGSGTVDEVTDSELPVGKGAELEVTAVGDRPVVLDRTASTLVLPGGDVVDLAGGAEARLQQPSGEADAVVVATPKGLVTQPLRGGSSTTRVGQGTPAAPVQLGGCTFGAWSGTGRVVRDCPGTDRDVDETLEGADGELAYRVNRQVIVLNDVSAGTLWMAAEDFEKVDDWDLKMPEDAEGEKTESETTTPEMVDQFVAQRDKPNRPPEPEDDSIGVRPGRTTVLNVLGNDLDPDGDVMTASIADPEGRVAGEGASDVSVDRVLDGAALQANVPETATGTTTFTYTVDDGRGGTADADVKVRVVPLSENEAPVSTGEPVLRVAQGGDASIKVLPFWRDPDGDDLVLSSAATADPMDEVRFRPDGTVEFRDGGTATGRKIVELTVTDGLDQVGEGRLLVDVIATQEPPVAVADHVTVLAGDPVTVRPLRNDSDPNGDRLRLVSVSEQAPATITENYAAGTFRFVSQEPGSYDITYQVSDGPGSTMGLVRVDVLPPPDAAGPPVVVADTVLLPAGGSALVDVLANDTDPGGGVLVASSVEAPPEVTAVVLDHHVLRVAETERLDRPVTLRYTASNGTETAVGQVRVVPIAAPTKLRPPEATPDETTVHTGDIVTVPVLKNDSHPDGLELKLTPELVEEPDTGEAFVSEDTVRFRAGSEAGTAHLVYEVRDSNGQKDSAQVTINITDTLENAAPQPPDTTARVLAGSVTRIPLPLDGSDPDGDYVTLDGLSAPPAQGTARVVDGFLEYEASEGAAGADEFRYSVTDTRGATAEGTVAVGVAQPPGVNQPPTAGDDETLVRPGRDVAVDALANDSDPDGDQVGLVPKSFEGAEGLDPRVVEDLVVVTTPRDEGTQTFYYGIEDTFAARATGAITVQTAKDAPLLRPVARDDVVPPADVTSDTVTVDVLRNDSDPDGVATDLTVAVLGEDGEQPAGVTLGEGGEVTVALTEDPQVLTYTVTDMDDLTAKAFLRVPRDGSLPHLKQPVEALRTFAGETLEIDIADHVVVADGHEPRFTVEEKVTAVEGTRDVTGPTTLTYTSDEDYVGRASVTFEVTDGDGPDDPEGRTAVLTLPIDVRASRNQPPEIKGTPLLEVAAGEESALDLSRVAVDPEGDPLTVEVTGAAEGITFGTQGATVTAQAQPSVPKGTRFTVPFTVSDGGHPPVAGELAVTVVASTRPLARANPDEVRDAHQGAAATVDVLANDANPFPEEPLKVVGAVVETGQGFVETTDSTVVVTPSDDFVGAMVVRYRVADATADVSREVEGTVRLTVLGRPEAPRAPQVEEVRSETVVLTWDPPSDNGAEITGYTARSGKGDVTECKSTTCTVTGLKNDVVYNFTVTATNEVGESEPSGPSEDARPDEKPDKPEPPSLKFGDSSLTVSWKNRTYTDRSPIECVNLEISPAPADGVIQKSCVTGSSIVWDGLANGTAYTVTVQAVNAAPDPSDWSDASAPETPAAPPAKPAAPSAQRVDNALGGQITVSWTEPANNGAPVEQYHLDVYRNGSKVETQTVTGTSRVVSGLSAEASYTFAVTAENKAGNSPASDQSAAQVPYGKPQVPGTPTAALGSTTSGQADVRWSGIAADDFRGPAHRYEVLANGGGTPGNAGTATSYTFKNLANGTAYRFQVRACNQYTCSAWTASSNPVTPYTTPGAPGVSWTLRSSSEGRFTVSPPGSNGGRAVESIRYRVNGGGWQSMSASGGNVDVGPAYSTGYSLEAQACNAAGCGTTASGSGRTNSNPANRSFTISKGADGSTSSGCQQGAACRWINMSITGWEPNTAFTMRCLTTVRQPAGQVYFPRYEQGNWWGQAWGVPLRTDGNGNWSGQSDCMHGYTGAQTWVETQELGSSNRLTW
ncbi:fibronectin type III domain-containing protein [Promicromonospora sukumoe]|uniref:fibronectin type III domain-containing protein n=1 Tax=Promicromonospora sukumoe TaxID=88382 RepID=UPI00039CFA72|nr:fibronectin type III domain-containing protein [Promicromonospora sukumoe]